MLLGVMSCSLRSPRCSLRSRECSFYSRRCSPVARVHGGTRFARGGCSLRSRECSCTGSRWCSLRSRGQQKTVSAATTTTIPTKGRESTTANVVSTNTSAASTPEHSEHYLILLILRRQLDHQPIHFFDQFKLTAQAGIVFHEESLIQHVLFAFRHFVQFMIR